ncbi:hypothetical protein P5673_017435 [Acropora cervicornis]|uniref:Uncharacterized protein n=1 Tax=Acropora cervicornis TaxID=6130 RepID=A0AAD9QEH1_ACRCE|nr:hypothetical protein P5673_017435 [Acropora cervicornis]
MEARRLSSFVDASTLYWREFWNAYAFPPFCLVGTCLQKVMLPQATLTIVVLLWCTRAWFTKLLSLLMDHPRIVRVTKGVFHNPILGQMTIQPQAKSTGMQDTGERLIKRNIPRDNTDHHHAIVERIEGTQNQYSARLALYDNQTLVLSLVFNATDSNKTSWFSKNRLIQSPWTEDLQNQQQNFFSLVGDLTARRAFFINKIGNFTGRFKP